MAVLDTAFEKIHIQTQDSDNEDNHDTGNLEPILEAKVYGKAGNGGGTVAESPYHCYN